jgi:hypothetical protein
MSVPAPAKETQKSLPLEERIRQRAYELYIIRGNESGSEQEDWLQAEAEVLEMEEQATEQR